MQPVTKQAETVEEPPGQDFSAWAKDPKNRPDKNGQFGVNSRN